MPEFELSAPWRRSGDAAFWLSRSAWSLLLIAQWRQFITGKASITVWLPDFFCNASLAPLRQHGAKLQFYPITDKMTPDWDACQTMTKKEHVDLFVLVHYFGQPTLAENAVLLCREKCAWLIEDAAHALRPITGIGEYGDFVLYSPHKHLAIPDGAVLLVRENGPAMLDIQSKAMDIFQNVYFSLINNPGFSSKLAFIWLVKRFMQRVGFRPLRHTITKFEQDVETIPSLLAHPKLSNLTRKLLPSLLGSLDDVKKIRFQNRVMWDILLVNNDPIKWTKNPYQNNFTPYLACFDFQDSTSAEKVFLKWQNAGIPVSTWPDIPPEVSLGKEQYQNALLLRKTRIYLSVHQTLTTQQIINCVKNLQHE